MKVDIIEFAHNFVDMIEEAKKSGATEEHVQEMTEALNIMLKFFLTSYESK